MDNFIVSARKYRPVDFDSVVGQESITRTLQNAISNNHLAQALLFCGPRGVGKTTCARILAKAINLDDKEKSEGEAKEEDFSFNIFELDAASNNSVEDIRNLIDQVRFPPQVGKYKVYIIDEVHMLSTQAFNAFLKTLEEPPKHAIFILATTEKHKIIPTILSRCQVYDFNRIQINDIASHLAKIAEKENVNAELDALHVIAEKADGALRDALSMFDQIVSYSGNELTYKSTIENLNILDYDYYFRVSNAILERNIPNVLLIFDEILQNGFDGHNFIVGLEQHFRNLLVASDSALLKLLEVGGSIRDKYKEEAGKFTNQLVLKAIEICNNCDINYKNSKNQRLLVELCLMQLCSIDFRKEAMTEASKKKDSELIPPSYNSNSPSTASVKEQSKEETIPASAKNEVSDTAKETVEWSQNKVREEKKTVEAVADDSVQTEEKETKETESKEELPISSERRELLEDAHQKTRISPKLSSNLRGQVKNSVRIGSFVEPEVKEKDKSSENELNSAANEYDENSFMEVWNRLAARAEENGEYTLLSILNKKPVIGEGDVIELAIDNKAQEEEFILQQAGILDEIRASLNNYNIRFNLTIDKDESKKKAYTATEKFKQMAEKNPHLNTLRDKLGLEINL